MSYIGKEPQFTQYPSKFFNGDGTAMTVTLDYSPPNAAALLVFIDGVRQDTSAYTLSGTSLTFTGTVPSGTNNVQVVHLGLTQDVGVPSDDTISTVKIQDDAVSTVKIQDNAVTSVKIQDDAVTSAKLANSLNITSGNSLTIDSGATITNNGTASGFGKLLQVQSYSAGITFSGTGDSSLSVSITPSSASNKIFIIATLARASGTGADGSNAYFGFKRNTTSLGNFANLQTDSNRDAGHTLSYLDSPSSTSSQTYLVTGNSAKISATANSTITVMEIAG